MFGCVLFLVVAVFYHNILDQTTIARMAHMTYPGRLDHMETAISTHIYIYI